MWPFGTISSGTVSGLSAARSPAGRPRLPVAKHRNRSPLEFSPTPPTRAIPSPARWASRSHWPGRSGAFVADENDDRPTRPSAGNPRQGDDLCGNVHPHGHAVDAEALAPAVVRLHEHADDVAVNLLDDARRCPDSALELVANHAGAAADVALRDRSGRCGFERGARVLGLDVHAVDVVERVRPRSLRPRGGSRSPHPKRGARPRRRSARRGRRRPSACS